MKFSLLGLDFEADVDCTPYKPAKVYGDPDDCYPEEGGEIDVTALTCEGHNAMYLLGSDLEDDILAAIEAALNDECAANDQEWEREA